MKKFMPIIVLTLSAFAWSASAQTIKILPMQSAVPHFVLTIGYYKTTVLIFPTPIDTADRGSNEIIAEKQAHLQNVLKVKAAFQGFSPTNLHVFTADSQLYAFDISYSDSPLITTFDLSKISRTEKGPDSGGSLQYCNRPLTGHQWAALTLQVKAVRPNFSIHSKKDGIKAKLETIAQRNGFYFFSIRLTNLIDLPYTMASADIVLSDKRKIRRSSAQERPLPTAYTDTLVSIPGKSSTQWVMAVPCFTVHRHQKLQITIYEKNDGRQIVLQIKKSEILRAQSLAI